MYAGSCRWQSPYLIWSAPTLATLNPVGPPIAHIGAHFGAIVHNSDTDLFLPPH